MSHVSIGKRVTSDEQTLRTWSGGTTKELLVYPPDSSFTAANYDFWIGTATIERSVDYSYFPGYMRVHLPIRGDGIRLHFRESMEVIDLETYKQYLFDGAVPVYAELLDGPVVAFNIISRNRVRSHVHIVTVEQGQDKVENVQHFAGEQTAQNDIAVRIIYVITGSAVIHLGFNQKVYLCEDDVYILNIEERNRFDEIVIKSENSQCRVVIADIVSASSNVAAVGL